jgi:hypothetical protein
MNGSLETVRQAAAPHGLNLVAAIPAHRYDSAVTENMRARFIDPNCRSLVVIGNGGGSFWRCFTEYAARRPGWHDRQNPLDDFTREIVEGSVAPVVQASGMRCSPVYPFVSDGPTLNFMELARLAGLAGPSIIGVVVHPVFGPWIALRAALLTDAALDAPGDAVGFDPCPSCGPRSCVSSCPAGAIAFPAGWDIRECLTYRVEAEADCTPRCHARAGCVLGPEHRYPDDELAYHQMRALRVMRPYYKTHIRTRPS